MDPRRFRVLLSLFYPFALALSVAGFLAFVLLVAGVDPSLVSTVTIWFYFACSAMLCAMLAPALRNLGFHRFFLGYIGILGLLALSLTLIIAFFV